MASRSSASGAQSAAVVKRMVGGNLWLSDVDGVVWATNRYWLAPVEAVRPLLEKFNVPADQVGGYEVNGSVRFNGAPDSAPRVGSMLNAADYPHALAKASIAAHDAYVRAGDDLVALYVNAEGTFVGARADYRDWLMEAATVPGYGREYQNIRLQASNTGPVPRLALVADAVTVRDGHYEGSYAEGNHRYVERTTEPAGTVLLAVIMSYRVNT